MIGRQTTAAIGLVLMVVMMTTACGGQRGASQDETTAGEVATTVPEAVSEIAASTPTATGPAPTVPAPPAPTSSAADAAAPTGLTLESPCQAWLDGSSAERQPLAQELASTPTRLAASVPKTERLVTRACQPPRGIMPIADAIADQLRAELERREEKEARRLAASRLSGPFARNVSRRIRRTWNLCGEGDVCVAGTKARAVGCSQPDLAVQRLRCLVITRRGQDGDPDSGYIVMVAVFDTEPMQWWLVGPA